MPRPEGCAVSAILKLKPDLEARLAALARARDQACLTQ